MAIEITESNFEETVLKSDKPVLIDFWAEWCAPCRQLLPTIDELSKEYEGKAIVGKVNVDVSPNLGQKFGFRTIPTLIFFKGGKEVERQAGALPKSLLQAKLNALL